MSIEVRRIVVAHLAEHGMDVSRIAAELGVSRETVRRDLHNRPAPAPAGKASAVTDREALVLPLDPPLLNALGVLRSACNGADTPAQNLAAARAAIRATADHVLEARGEVT